MVVQVNVAIYVTHDIQIFLVHKHEKKYEE